MLDTTYNVNHHPEINPLIGTSVAETAANCASALRWLTAIDINRLCDQASEDGLFPVIYPILTALECSAAREQGSITLNCEEAARLLTFARQHHQGNIFAALDAVIDAAEIAVKQKAEVEAAERPARMRECWQRVANQAAEELAALNADQGEVEASNGGAE